MTVAPVVRTDDVESTALPEAVYFGVNGGVAGMIHRPPGRAVAAVLLVEPFGIEALAAEATFRTLTLQLVRSGAAVVRMAPPGAGDSADPDPAASIVGPWIGAVRDAIALARTLTPTGAVDVVALRLGATITAYATAASAVRRLVLWAPVSGKSFAREFTLLGAAGAPAPAAEAADPDRLPAIEAGGFALCAPSLAELAALDIGRIDRVGAGEVLLVDRDDLPGPPRVAAHLSGLGAAVSVIRPCGYAAMRLDDPEEGAVPEESLAAIGSWLGRESACPPVSDGGEAPAPTVQTLPTLRITAHGVALEERPAWIRSGGVALFAITTMGVGSPGGTPARGSGRPLPAVVLFTTGSNPRCGAGRIQTLLARRLAARGHVVVRFDRRGVGASLHTGTDGGVLTAPGSQGLVDPYDPVHDDDAGTVMDHVVNVLGGRELALVGLCSGAYVAFHRAKHAVGGTVRTVVLVNQILFTDRSWTTRAESPAMAVKAGYELRRGWRNPKKWKALLCGTISVRTTLSRLRVLACMRLGRVVTSGLERVGLRRPGMLAQHLLAISRAGVRQLYVFDDAETGLGHLQLEAARAVRTLRGSGDLRIRTATGAGHIFGSQRAKDWLLDTVVDELSPDTT